MQSSHQYRFRLVAALLLGSVGLGSCGNEKPHVERQQRDHIAGPAYPQPVAGLGLALVAEQGKGESRYEGPMIIWRPEVDAAQMAEVIKAKVAVMDADLAYKKAALPRDRLRSRSVIIANEIAKNKQAIDSKLDLDELYRSQAATLRADAKDWVAVNVDTPAARAAYGQFCQAQLWRFATSAFLRKQQFGQRPSPLGLCEPYYEDHSYFKGEACSDAPTNLGKSYVPCMWGEGGVAKTSVKFFDSDTLDELQGGELVQLYEVFATQAWQENTRATADIAKDSMLTILSDKTYLLDFIGPYEHSLAQILTDMEFLTSSQQEQKTQWQALLEERTPYAEDGSERTIYSFNDTLFNSPYLVNTAPLRMQEADLDALLDFAAKAPNLFGKALSKEDRNKVAELKTANVNLSKEKEQLAVVVALYENDTLPGQMGYELANKYERWTTAKSNLASYINRHTMVQAFWPYAQLTLQRKDGVVIVRLQLDNSKNETRPAVGCYSAADYTPATCPQATLAEGAVSLNLQIDHTTGMLALEVSHSSSSSFYMAPIAASRENAPYFQDASLTQEALAGMRVRFELLPGLHAHELPIFTGKVFLNSAGAVLAEGSVSLTKTEL